MYNYTSIHNSSSICNVNIGEYINVVLILTYTLCSYEAGDETGVWGSCGGRDGSPIML